MYSAGRATSWRTALGDVSGAVADLGVFVPLVASLVMVCGLQGGPVLVWAGLMLLAAGWVFRVPFPVQPLKALTAVAVSLQLGPDVIHAAGLLLGGFLILLSVRGVADVLARLFTPPVVRALQFGVGVLLVIAAWRLAVRPPDIFRADPGQPWGVAAAIAAFAVVAMSAQRGRYWVALVVLIAGVGAGAAVAGPQVGGPDLQLPVPGLPPLDAFGPALVLLVIPQLPLTFGNAVVAVNDVAHGWFGVRARRVSPARVCLVAGAANVLSAAGGGMPMCHGSGGLTAHARLGATTAAMNAGLGGSMLLTGLLFGPHVMALLGLLPAWALAAFLAYAGIRHALLVSDQRGRGLVLAVVAGSLGAWLGNLAVTAALGLLVEHGWRLAARRSSGLETVLAQDPLPPDAEDEPLESPRGHQAP